MSTIAVHTGPPSEAIQLQKTAYVEEWHKPSPSEIINTPVFP